MSIQHLQLTPRLSSEDVALLLSLSDSELCALLEPLAATAQASILRQMEDYRTPTELATEKLHEFVQQAWHLVEPETEFVDGMHVRALCEHLQAVTAGRIKDLLINIPPGCMKSLLTSVFWPAWVWANNPSSRFLFASYDQTLSTRDSTRCRYIIESTWYQERWGHVFQIVGDQNQKTRYDTTGRGWRMATSVGGRGTGEHPDYIVVDDPHNAKQAESDAKRQQALEWWDGTISTRGRTRGVRRVVVMQRLHKRDLSGHILEKGGFDHICLPLEYEPPVDGVPRMQPTGIGWTDPRTEPGELLWPDLFTPEVVRKLKVDLGSLRAAGQLQQRPEDLSGGIFKREYFRDMVSDYPKDGIRVCRYWDKAATEGGGDYSAGVLMVERLGVFYVVDVVRGQWSAHKRNEIISATAKRDAMAFGYAVWTVVEQEGMSGGKESAEISIKQLVGHNIRKELMSGKGSKAWRSLPFSAQCEAGNVKIVMPANGGWPVEFIDELVAFPRGANDDQVDAVVGAFRKLALPRGAPTVERDLLLLTNEEQRELATEDAAVVADELPRVDPQQAVRDALARMDEPTKWGW